MPNHIISDVEISGPNIKKLIEATKIKLDSNLETNEFDFNGIVKMPEELNKTTSPTTIVDTQEEADEKNEADRKAAERNKWSSNADRYLSKAEHDRRIKEYGADNWYDWSNNNWGTKWNAYEVRYIAHDEEKLVLSLQTAWDTPREIWDELKESNEVGVMYGEMDGYEYIGDGADVFEAYVNVDVDYVGDIIKELEKVKKAGE